MKMCDKLLFVACFVVVMVVANGGPVSFITKCKAENSKCIKESTKKAIPFFSAGIPELGVGSLDPLFYKELNASSKNLKLMLNDIVLTGVEKCETKKMVRDVDKSTLEAVFLCDVEVKGKYEMGGRLLFLPIEGKGNVYAKLNKVELSAVISLVEKSGKDGEKHLHIKDWSYMYFLKDKAQLELENLFDKNEVLARAARELIDGSPNEVIFEVGTPIIKALITRAVKEVNHFFHHVPLDQLVVL